MNASSTPTAPTPRSIALFALLMAIGVVYLLALGFFLRHSVNFVQKGGIDAARAAVAGERPELPVHYTFDASSPWVKSLAYGWNRPEPWGIWAEGSSAAIVLPPIPGDATQSVCFDVKLGTASKRRQWPMLVTIAGQPFGGPQRHTGAGPFELRGMLQVSGGQPILIRFDGPSPRIPRAVTQRSMDSRLLSFSLFGITITKHC